MHRPFDPGMPQAPPSGVPNSLGSSGEEEDAEEDEEGGQEALTFNGFRKRGRPRKYEGLNDTERRRRRMADNRLSAKRSYYRKVTRMKELEDVSIPARGVVLARCGCCASLTRVRTGERDAQSRTPVGA